MFRGKYAKRKYISDERFRGAVSELYISDLQIKILSVYKDFEFHGSKKLFKTHYITVMGPIKA